MGRPGGGGVPAGQAPELGVGLCAWHVKCDAQTTLSLRPDLGKSKLGRGGCKLVCLKEKQTVKTLMGKLDLVSLPKKKEDFLEDVRRGNENHL